MGIAKKRFKHDTKKLDFERKQWEFDAMLKSETIIAAKSKQAMKEFEKGLLDAKGYRRRIRAESFSLVII